MNIFLYLSMAISVFINSYLFFNPEKNKFNLAIVFIFILVGIILLAIGAYEALRGK